jgi:hypothetical protein
MAVSTGNMHHLEERRKPLIAVNPFYAETSELPPQPKIEDVTYEHMSLNLSTIARSALNDLNQEMQMQEFETKFPNDNSNLQKPDSNDKDTGNAEDNNADDSVLNN